MTDQLKPCPFCGGRDGDHASDCYFELAEKYVNADCSRDDVLAAWNRRSGWQPIETAPRDRTEILAWREDAGCMLIRWDCAAEMMTQQEIESSGLTDDQLFAEDWFCADFAYGCRLEGSDIPTHWMPLPEPPNGNLLATSGESKGIDGA